MSQIVSVSAIRDDLEYYAKRLGISTWVYDNIIRNAINKRALEDLCQRDEKINEFYNLYLEGVTLYAESLFSFLSTDKSLKLQNVLKKEKFAWTKLYKIIQAKEPYDPYGFIELKGNWVYWLSIICDVRESVLWNYRKAGFLYERYYKRNHENNPDLPPLENLRVSATNLVLIDRIAARNINREDKLISDLLAGKIHHIDLKKSWDTVKLSRKENHLPIHPINAEDVYKMKTPQEALDTSEIISAFKDSSCIGLNKQEIRSKEPLTLQECYGTRGEDLIMIRYKPSYSPFEYQTIAGLETTAGKIDLAIIENLSVEESLRTVAPHIHAVIIKPDIYIHGVWTPPDNCNYADFLWLVIPEDEILLKLYKGSLPEEWGILAYNDGKLKLERQAQLIAKPNIEPTLRAIALRLK